MRVKLRCGVLVQLRVRPVYDCYCNWRVSLSGSGAEQRRRCNRLVCQLVKEDKVQSTVAAQPDTLMECADFMATANRAYLQCLHCD